MKTIKYLSIAVAAFLISSCGEEKLSDDVRISWDGASSLTLTEMPLSDGTVVKNLCYPRAKHLSDGSILLSFMDDHYGWNSFVAKSYDGGATWTDASCIRHRHPGVSTMGEDEVVFVNPDFIELSDGRIMLAHQWRYANGYNDLPNTNENCGIEVMFSSDKGLSWTEAVEVYRGRCWEPAMLQLPSGEIQMYITDSQNVVNRMSCPKTVVIRSFDGGKTWQGKPMCSYKDVEAISHTRDDRFGYDGMPSGVLLDNGDIVVPLEVWSGKYVVDNTPVVVRTSASDNWNYDQEKILSEGGPDYPAKKQVNKDFIGYGPYSCRLQTGEMLILSNGNYKGMPGVWVFVGDRNGDNFTHATTPFEGYWGCIDNIDRYTVLASGSVKYSQDGSARYRVPMMKGHLNYSKSVTSDLSLAPVSEFDRNDSDFWFLGKTYPSAVYADFGRTSDALVIGAYVFDKKLTAFTVENSDAPVFHIGRRGEIYKAAVNADGKYTIYRQENCSWHLIASGSDAEVSVTGTVNDDSDEDLGYSAKMSIPWSVIGGKPRKGEIIRVNMARMYKPDSKEKPGASYEELQGENSDYPSEWLKLEMR